MSFWEKIKASFTRPRNLYDSILLLGIGIALFAFGFHNADTGQNLKWLNGMVAVQSNYTIENFLVDNSLIGIPITPDVSYASGILLMFFGFMVTAFSAYCIGYYMKEIELIVNEWDELKSKPDEN